MAQGPVFLRFMFGYSSIIIVYLVLSQTKANFDKECKICTRPFTVFRWRPGRDARYKKTEVCQTCSKLKNVCQVCLLDLEYGLPVQVRDTALGINTSESIPKSDVNREFFAEEQDRKVMLRPVIYLHTFFPASPFILTYVPFSSIVVHL